MTRRVHSRNKGARFERWLAAYLRDALGLDDSVIRRGLPQSGGAIEPDVVAPMVWIEAKHWNRVTPALIRRTIDQARSQCGGRIWIAVIKETRGEIRCFADREGWPAEFGIAEMVALLTALYYEKGVFDVRNKSKGHDR